MDIPGSGWSDTGLPHTDLSHGVTPVQRGFQRSDPSPEPLLLLLPATTLIVLESRSRNSCPFLEAAFAVGQSMEAQGGNKGVRGWDTVPGIGGGEKWIQNQQKHGWFSYPAWNAAKIPGLNVILRNTKLSVMSRPLFIKISGKIFNFRMSS